MKILPIILASAMNAQPIEDVKVPMTAELMGSIQNFVGSSLAVCQKRKTPEKQCSSDIDKKTLEIRKKANGVCKDFPKEQIPCLQYGLGYLMDIETKRNVLSLTAKDI